MQGLHWNCIGVEKIMGTILDAIVSWTAFSWDPVTGKPTLRKCSFA